MTTVLISKADFIAANLVKFSGNIPEDQLQPFIYAAQEYDLEPRLGGELYDAILTYAETPDGTRPQLDSFIKREVRRFLVLAAYRRFIATHGMNVTQFGLTKTADPQGTFNQAEASERAVILRQVDADANVALGKMISVTWTFDGVTYAKDKKRLTPSASIRAPKRATVRDPYTGTSYKDLI
jgi:hypothetical protein